MRLVDDALGCTARSEYAADNPEKVHSLVSAFHGAQLSKTRAAMLAGDSVAACRSCDDQESMGRQSIRQVSNNLFGRLLDWNQLIRNTGTNGEVAHFPMSLELRFGNYCNLTCKMCSYPTSHSLKPSAQPNWCRLPIDPYREDPGFWDGLRDLCPTLLRVYFAGGEPLVQPGHLRALTLFVERGAASRMYLSYSTNLTVLPEKVVALWRHFRHVHVGASCDGFGLVYESIRKGGHWETFARNVRAARECTDLTLDVTVQKDNVATLDQLWEWSIEERVNVSMGNILRSPVDLRMEALTGAQLSECLQRYDECSARYRALGRMRLATEVEQLCVTIAGALDHAIDNTV